MNLIHRGFQLGFLSRSKTFAIEKADIPATPFIFLFYIIEMDQVMHEDSWVSSFTVDLLQRLPTDDTHMTGLAQAWQPLCFAFYAQYYIYTPGISSDD